MLPAETAKALFECEPIKVRLITARFYAGSSRISIVQGYAPTNDEDLEEKEEFYNALQRILDKILKRDLIVIMKGYNAKVGSDNTGREEVLSRHGEGTMNLNGELYGDFGAFISTVIGGSIFPHKRIHKTTWMSPDQRIDHIYTSKRYRRS